MNTLLNSSSGNKKYLFKDGALIPSIALGVGLSIKNNLIYTNKAGGTNWTIQQQIEAGQTVFVRLTCTGEAGSTNNEAYCRLTAGQNGMVKFPGEGEQNVHLTLGVRSNSTISSFNMYLYTYGDGMGIEELWIE